MDLIRTEHKSGQEDTVVCGQVRGQDRKAAPSAVPDSYPTSANSGVASSGGRSEAGLHEVQANAAIAMRYRSLSSLMMLIPVNDSPADADQHFVGIVGKYNIKRMPHPAPEDEFRAQQIGNILYDNLHQGYLV